MGAVTVTTVLKWHLSQSPWRLAEVTLALATGAFGFLFDSPLIAFGVFSPVRPNGARHGKLSPARGDFVFRLIAAGRVVPILIRK